MKWRVEKCPLSSCIDDPHFKGSQTTSFRKQCMYRIHNLWPVIGGVNWKWVPLGEGWRWHGPHWAHHVGPTLMWCLPLTSWLCFNFLLRGPLTNVHWSYKAIKRQSCLSSTRNELLPRQDTCPNESRFCGVVWLPPQQVSCWGVVDTCNIFTTFTSVMSYYL